MLGFIIWKFCWGKELGQWGRKFSFLSWLSACMSVVLTHSSQNFTVKPEPVKQAFTRLHCLTPVYFKFYTSVNGTYFSKSANQNKSQENITNILISLKFIFLDQAPPRTDVKRLLVCDVNRSAKRQQPRETNSNL